jgi:hypothetical protein
MTRRVLLNNIVEMIIVPKSLVKKRKFIGETPTQSIQLKKYRKREQISADQAKTIITEACLRKNAEQPIIIENLKKFSDMKITSLFIRHPAPKMFPDSDIYLFNVDEEHMLFIRKDNSIKIDWDWSEDVE